MLMDYCCPNFTDFSSKYDIRYCYQFHLMQMHPTDAQWQCLKEIQAMVQTQLRPEARVSLQNYFLSQTPRHPYEAYIKFVYEGDNSAGDQPDTLLPPGADP